MGVPKFFRWLYERYPCLCEVVREYQIPEFDNLYLDMNGIIHICSHPNDFDPQFRITEEKIFKDIFHYIEILFRMIQPQKLFFMAVDGVAPRAKLNQQRGRRFRTAKEAIDLEKKAVESGLELPKEERFDSNCITPGTEFMERLHHQLRYFIADKMSHDKLWKNVKVILSGHETPGEGEHKIMDYIRYMKSQPDYDHNTRHCLYGLDADLIMLGLCTHEPHFALLREEVKFNKRAKRASTPEGTKFYLLHLSLMRDYLDWEFSNLKDKLPFGYDLERIIDDWVLMGFLVGNDFIPHLPGLHIANGALMMLHKAYMDILPTLGGYINEEGTLNLSRFQRYMEKLAAFDIHQFKDEYTDLKYFEGKTSRKLGGKERLKLFECPDDVVMEPLEPSTNRDPKLEEMIQFTEMQLENLTVSNTNKDEDLEQLFGGIEDDFHEEEDDDDDDEDEPSNADMYHEFYQKKRDYYTNKLEFDKVTPEVLRSQAEGYVRAIQWNLHYYYNGVCSWSWFYPHHYAPYISDIKNFCDLELKFDMGKPFLPFQQLLAVLPSLSKTLLPEPFYGLMIDENSPIIDYYPSTFQTDLNGKRQEWEAVVLIPFIDEERLLTAMEPLLDKLTEEEKRRNKHGPMLVYTYSGKSVGTFEAPYFPPIENNHALEKRVMRDEIFVPVEKLQKGLCCNVALDEHFPGFPTLRHVPHKASLQKGKVKVFESTTRGESVILQIKTDEIVHWKKDTVQIAEELLGRSFQVAWPHLREAKIVEVLDSKCRYTLGSLESSKVKENAEEKSVTNKIPLNIEEKPQEWSLILRSILEHYNTFLGIQLGPIPVIVRALPMAGEKYSFTPSGKVNLDKEWTPVPVAFALQTVVKDIKVNETKSLDCKTIHELFPPKTVVFLLSVPHYGSMGQVTEIMPAVPGKVARVKIALHVVPEPDMESVKARLVNIVMKYYPGGVAAQRIGISGHLLSRITGTIYISRNDGDPFSKNINIGLSLKFNKKNEEVPGFTKKDNNIWLYSDQCVVLLNNYIKKFPDLFAYLAENTNTNEFQESAVFPENSNSGMTLKDVMEWLSEQPHSKVEHRSCGAEVLEEDVIHEIEKEVESMSERISKGAKTVTITVQPHLVYKPGFKMGHMQPDKTTKYLLYDRVVNVRECYTVPLGLRGTVIGIQRAERQEDMLYDIVFDSSFEGGVQILGCSPGRGYRLPAYALINLSHGERHLKVGNDTITAAISATKAHSQSAVSVLPSGNVLIRHPPNAHSSLGGSRTQHGGLPDRPASAFASWHSGCTGGAPAKFPGKEGYTNHRGPPKFDSFPNSDSKGKERTILKRPTPGQTSQPPDQSQASNCAVDFQIMWRELQKTSVSINKGEEVVKTSSSFTTVMNVNQQRPAEAVDSNEAKDSGTDILKKILRIDNSSSASSATSSSKPQTSQPVPLQTQKSVPPEEISQPSVQDFFEKAKAVSAKQQEQHQKNPVNYCVQLISMFQRTGLGIPRYDYVKMDNGMVMANLALPNLKTFQGEPSTTIEKASESVAKVALAQMNSWSKQDTNFGGMPMPANKLPAPPQQWCQPPPMQQQQQHGHYAQYGNQPPWQNNIYQKLNWREHPDQSAEWRRRNPTQWQGNRLPPPPMYPQRFMVPQYHYPQYPPYQAQQQHPQWNNNSNQPTWRQQPPPMKQPEFTHGANGPAAVNPFVPLQAVRAQMSANSQQVQSPKRQKHSKKHQTSEEHKLEDDARKLSTSTPKKTLPEERKTTESVSKDDESKKDMIPSVEQNVLQACDRQDNDKKQPLKNEDGETKSKSRDHVKRGKQVYVPPMARKSRLAIKFGAEQ